MAEKIMIVDDEPNTLRLLQHIIQGKGYQTIAVQSGAEALSRMRTEQPDLMILDVMMPDLSGLEVCRQVRADATLSRLPIIMLSARTQVADKVSGLQAGADEYVTKPIAAAELLARIEALLQASRRWAQREPVRKQRIIGLIGAKGGVGATTLTLNVAAALAQDKKDVVAIELCSRLGGFALQLKQQPTQNIASLLVQETRFTAKALADRLLSLPLQFRILCGPQSPAEFADISAEQVEMILNGLISIGDYVILDMANLSLAATQKTAQCCDHLVLVAETEPICVAAAKSLLDLFKSWEITAKQIGLVAINRTPLASAMSLRTIRAQLDCDILGVVPYAADMQVAAQAAGIPLVAYQPNSLAATSMIEIAQRLSAETIAGIRME
jgi:pilus assembly protein CpaE